MRFPEHWVVRAPVALRTRFLSHRDAILLGRVRWCVALVLIGVAFALLELPAVSPATRPTFLFIEATFVVGALLVWGVSRLPFAERHAVALVLTALLGATIGMALCFRVLDQDRGVTTAGFVAITMGSATLFPLGVGPQAAMGLVSLLGYLGVAGPSVGSHNVYDLALVVNAVAVSLVGAFLVDHYRFELFKESWQREGMVAFGRELAANVDLDAANAAVLRHGMILLGADGGAVALRDVRREVYRIEAVSGQRHGGRRWLVGLEFPQDMPAVREIVDASIVEAAPGDPGRPVLQSIGDLGIRRVLMVVMRHGAEPIGLVCFARRDATPFAADERMLARGLADHAALALQTARTVADLRAANRAKSDFVSTMSHELRTPLNVIVGYSQMARDGVESGEEALGRIEAAGLELLGLVEGTLEIGRMEAGRDETQLESVDLRAFWGEVGTECRRMLRRPAVTFEWVEPAPALVLRTDPRKLRVVLRNLVGNALKFTDTGQVRGEATLDGGVLQLRISDTGVGIRPEDQEVVFEMFRQADGSDSRRFGGTGLGLYIVRRFTGQLGGTVRLDSSPGCGATFTLVFPQAGARSGAVRAA
jgi:signal transduction histidine kinase